MASLAAALARYQHESYSFNKSLIPFPQNKEEKIKPPENNFKFIDNKQIFKKKNPIELKQEELTAKKETYLKAHRVIITNFFTGGSAYRRGAMDVIYKGYNPMKK